MFSIDAHFNGQYPKWYLNRSFFPPKSGFDCCSDEWVSFHYMSPEKMIRLHTVIERQTELYKQKQTTNRKPTFKSTLENYFAYERFRNLFLKAKI